MPNRKLNLNLTITEKLTQNYRIRLTVPGRTSADEIRRSIRDAYQASIKKRPEVPTTGTRVTDMLDHMCKTKTNWTWTFHDVPYIDITLP